VSWAGSRINFSARFRADYFAGGETGAGIEPAGEALAAGKQPGLARQIGEDRLGHVLGEVGIAADHAQGGGIDKVHVAPDQFGKGFFGTGLGVLANQFVVRRHILPDSTRRLEDRTEKVNFMDGRESLDWEWLKQGFNSIDFPLCKSKMRRNPRLKMFLTAGVNCANLSGNSLQDSPCRIEY
jgi:hypothetical protein